MARHKHYEATESPDPALDISSLIDVCFLLLIYFIVTSTIQPRESDLRLKLPVPNEQDNQPLITPMFIQVDANNSISIGTGNSQQMLDSDAESRNLPLLCSYLDIYVAAARSAFNQPLVQLWVADGASQQRVIDVLNSLATKEISSVTFTDLGT